MSRISKYMKEMLVAAAIASIAILLLSCQDSCDKPDQAIEAVVDSVSSADGVTIYYDVRGEGDPALVFVHCWSCDRSYWDGQVDEFAKNHKVVTIDLAGHGQSGLERTEWTIPAFGADVAAVANKLGLEKMILIGHSMGGPVTVEAARQLPGKVIGLVGVDNFQNIGISFPEDDVKAFLEPFQADFKNTTHDYVLKMFPPGADSTLSEKIAQDMSDAPSDVAFGAFMGMFKYYFGPPIIDALKEINLPLVCISSDQTPTNIEGNRQVVPSFDVKLMPGTGHFLHLEDPETFNKLLTETVKELTSKGTE